MAFVPPGLKFGSMAKFSKKRDVERLGPCKLFKLTVDTSGGARCKTNVKLLSKEEATTNVPITGAESVKSNQEDH